MRVFLLGVVMGASLCANGWLTYMLTVKLENTVQVGKNYKIYHKHGAVEVGK